MSGILINPYSVAPASAPFTNTYSLDFDAVDERLDLGNKIDLGTTSSEGIWIKRDNASANGNIMEMLIQDTPENIQ